MRTDKLGRRINPKQHEHSTTHGGFKNSRKTYQTWQDMKQRCCNPKSQQYKNYGGRGISVCDRWINSFENFLSDMGEKPDGTTIERIDVNKNYAPENCRWATNLEQQRNKRTCHVIEFNGLKMTRAEWAKHLGIPEGTLQYRFAQGWPVHLALDPKIVRRGRNSKPREFAAIKEQKEEA